MMVERLTRKWLASSSCVGSFLLSRGSAFNNHCALICSAIRMYAGFVITSGFFRFGGAASPEWYSVCSVYHRRMNAYFGAKQTLCSKLYHKLRHVSTNPRIMAPLPRDDSETG